MPPEAARNNPAPRVSVIIPAKDGVKRLQRLLDSLADHLPPTPMVEITVVDDGSRPPLAGQLERFSGRVLRVDENHGPAHARNLGAAESAGDVLFFLDADVVYAAGALEQALNILDAHPDIGAVSFANQAHDTADGVVANFGAAMEHFWMSGRVPDGEAFGEPAGFTTRNGLVRRACFEAVSGFDTRYRTNAHEDYDIGKRLEACTRTVIAREPLLYHAFPTRVSRIARNYWVRTSLFVPYFARFRPTMDKTQVTGSEALLRLAAIAPVALVLLAALLLPIAGWFVSTLLFIVALTAIGGYAWRIRRFLAACHRWSGGSPRFVAAALGLHLLTSLFITAGGLYGLWRLVRGDTPKTLWSPFRPA